MTEEVVIIGGGVAGLSAAFHLADLGLKPLLIEGGHFPSHKVCGEFFSPESVPYLKNFAIEPTVWIKKIAFAIKNKSWEHPLPAPAAGLSRFYFDNQLKIKAEEKGARILADTVVKAVDFNVEDSTYHLSLSSGEKIETSSLVIGAGRVSQLLSSKKSKAPPFPYIGLKAHFEGIDAGEKLEFHFTGDAYLGLSPIGEGKSNVACLVRKESIDKAGGVKEWIDALSGQSEFSFLRKGKMLFPDWLIVSAPPFGLKRCLSLPNVYFIGDARGTIPPITGEGLSIALSSGLLVAEYVKRKDALGFDKAWRKHYKGAIRWGICLHHAMLNPYISSFLERMVSWFPGLLTFFFKRTRAKRVQF